MTYPEGGSQLHDDDNDVSIVTLNAFSLTVLVLRLSSAVSMSRLIPSASGGRTIFREQRRHQRRSVNAYGDAENAYRLALRTDGG